MFDPEQIDPDTKKYRRTLKTSVTATEQNSIGQSGRIGDEQALRYYIRNSGMVAANYGLKIVGRAGKRKLEIADLERINKLDEVTKQILRELLKEGEY